MPVRIKRLIALLVDLACLGLTLAAISVFLPDGPPPVDAMAFFTPADFRNYFILVGVSIVLSGLHVVPMPGTSRTLSPGHWLFGLRLVDLAGNLPSAGTRIRRWLWGVIPLLLVLVPGPLISLFVGATAAELSGGRFTTPADVLDRLGAPGWLSYTLHGLSFAALAAALLYVLVLPWRRRSQIKGAERELTPLDRRTSTTHIGDA